MSLALLLIGQVPVAPFMIYLAGNELIGPYIWVRPMGTVMCNWNYIGRARSEARRAVKFQ